MSKKFGEGKGQPAHKNVEGPAHSKNAHFDNVKEHSNAPHSPGKSHALSGYEPGTGNVVPHKNNKQAGGKHRGTPGGFGGHHKHDHPMAHREVHHASMHNNGGHKGFHGEAKLLHTHKISERPMGAFRYSEVFKGK